MRLEPAFLAGFFVLKNREVIIIMRRTPVQRALMILIPVVVWILYGLRTLKAPTSIVLTVAAGFTAALALFLGSEWKDIENGIYSSVRSVVPAILILLLVGMLIGVWILSGTVPAMTYYGLQFLPPSFFLVAATLLCCLISLGTGTSWGTISTVGIALLGIGGGLGIPLPAVVGAIVVGAFFGDKMSPLSDTTNLAAAVTDTDLFLHIKHMLLTTVPALLISLAVFAILGFRYASTTVDASAVELFQAALATKFVISPWMLIPPVLVIALILKKKPVLPALFIGIAAGAVLAVLAQSQTLATVFVTMNRGFVGTTGHKAVDSLLNRGGLTSMLGTTALIIAASSFGGAMRGSKVLDALVESLSGFIKNSGTLVLSTAIANLGIVLLTGSCYVSMSVLGPVFTPLYKKLGIGTETLSRTLEDTGTVVVPLIPWSITGIFVADTLGVPVLAYLPYAIMCYMSGVIAIIYGFTGKGIARTSPAADIVSTTIAGD